MLLLLAGDAEVLGLSLSPRPGQPAKKTHAHHHEQRLVGEGEGRRSFLAAAFAGVVSAAATTTTHKNSPAAWAAMTDETDTFADNWWKSSSSPPKSTTQSQTVSPAQATDEVTIRISKAELQKQRGLGLELADIEFRTNLRVYVKNVAPNSYAQQLGIAKDWIVVAVNGINVERTNANGVAQYVAQAVQQAADVGGSFPITFRDPTVFRQKLQNLNADEGPVTTQVAPAGDTTPRNADGSVRKGQSVTTAAKDQRITVEQLVKPPNQMCRRGATADDLLELSYQTRVVETGQLVDGSAVLMGDGKGIPGRGNDVTIYFVLGNKQLSGQFPPSWEVALEGMCVGERRRLTVPPALAYGSKGLPRRNIPPDATLQYDVTLVSLNGLATPQ